MIPAFQVFLTPLIPQAMGGKFVNGAVTTAFANMYNKWSDWSGSVHAGLDAGGLTPALGIFADVANSIIYGMEGDWGNAALAMGAAVPGAGQAVTGGKWAGRTARLKPDVAADGAHTVFRRGGNGEVKNYSTFTPNPKNPTGFDLYKRFDRYGGTHMNKVTNQRVPTPHIHSRTTAGGVRSAKPWEIPR